MLKDSWMPLSDLITTHKPVLLLCEMFDSVTAISTEDQGVSEKFVTIGHMDEYKKFQAAVWRLIQNNYYYCATSHFKVLAWQPLPSVDWNL